MASAGQVGPAEAPTGAGGHVDKKPQRPRLADGEIEHLHPLGREIVDVSRLATARTVDRYEVHEAEAGVTKLLQVPIYVGLRESAARAPPIRTWPLLRADCHGPRGPRLGRNPWGCDKTPARGTDTSEQTQHAEVGRSPLRVFDISGHDGSPAGISRRVALSKPVSQHEPIGNRGFRGSGRAGFQGRREGKTGHPLGCPCKKRPSAAGFSSTRRATGCTRRKWAGTVCATSAGSGSLANLTTSAAHAPWARRQGAGLQSVEIGQGQP